MNSADPKFGRFASLTIGVPLSEYFANRAETYTGLRLSVGQHIRAENPVAHSIRGFF